MKRSAPIRPLLWRHHLAFRWAFSPQRRADLRTAALLTLILIAYGIAGRMDYEDALISEAQASEARASEARAELHQRQLLACVNGGMSGLYSESADGTRRYVICGRAWEVSDENMKVKP